MAIATKRRRIEVTRDDDGGLTLHDPASGVVLSVVATHPDANGPKGLFVEAYAWKGGDVLANDLPQRGSDAPVGLRTAHHLTTAYYAENR